MRKNVVLTILVAGLWIQAAQPTFAYIRPGSNSRISVGENGQRGELDDGVEPFRSDSEVSITPNGRFVAFSSSSTLSSNDLNPNPLWPDVYVRDRKQKETKLATSTPSGQPPVFVPQPLAPRVIGFSRAAISASGRYVAFISDAANLVDGDTNLMTDVFVSDRSKGTMERVTLAPDGAEADGPSEPSAPIYGGSGVAISATGRYVAFHSQASNLIDNDENVGRCAQDGLPPGTEFANSCTGGWDTFVRDRKTGETRLISVSSEGQQSDGDSGHRLSISANGRYVMFLSNALNLADLGPVPCPGEWSTVVPKRCHHAYVHDLQTSKTELVSVNTQEEPADMTSFLESHQGLSADGRYALFGSHAQNLVPAGGNGVLRGPAIYMRDRRMGRTTRVDVTSTGAGIVPDVAGCQFPGLSADGRYVGYSCNERLYVHDRHTGETQLSSFGNSGEPVAGNIMQVRVSRGGRDVAFASNALGWVEGDPTLPTDELAQRDFDVYVRDRGDAVSSGTGGQGGKDEDDGDEVCIGAICIDPTDPISYRDLLGDVPLGAARLGADLRAASFASRPSLGDLFVRIELERFPPVTSSTSGEGPLYGLRFRADGLDYEVRIQKAPRTPVSLDRGASTFTLFRCQSGSICSRAVAELEGGYGTTGEAIVFSLPLKRIGLDRGGTLGDVEAFSGAGTMSGGAGTLWDRVVASQAPRAERFIR